MKNLIDRRLLQEQMQHMKVAVCAIIKEKRERRIVNQT